MEIVLHSLPEDMRDTLSRPGLTQTVPRPLQGLCVRWARARRKVEDWRLEPSTAGETWDAKQRRRRDLQGVEDDENLHDGANSEPSRAAVPEYDDEERTSSLGQFILNPFLLLSASGMPLLLECDNSQDAQQTPTI